MHKRMTAPRDYMDSNDLEDYSGKLYSLILSLKFGNQIKVYIHVELISITLAFGIILLFLDDHDTIYFINLFDNDVISLYLNT